MRVDSNYRPRVNLDEEHRLGWLGWILLSGLGLVMILAPGAIDKLADYVKFMSIFD